MIKCYTNALAIVAAIVSCLHSPSATTGEASAEWFANHYAELQRITSAPVAVDPSITAACTTSVNQGQFGGPHAEAAISIYVNDITRSALTESSSFAPGAVIVKLKHRDAQNPRGKEAIGGMIKRNPGYNPASGDWEFFYRENGKLESGRLSSCIECHATASKSDYVFASWIGNSILRQDVDVEAWRRRRN